MSIFHVEDRFFGLPKVQEGLQHHICFNFDGKQHCKKNLVPWMLKSPLTSVLKEQSYSLKLIHNQTGFYGSPNYIFSFLHVCVLTRNYIDLVISRCFEKAVCTFELILYVISRFCPQSKYPVLH